MPLQQIPTELTRDERGPEAFSVELCVNGAVHALEIEPRVTLLDALRERLRLKRHGFGATPPSATRTLVIVPFCVSTTSATETSANSYDARSRTFR